jgi:hypothetical protein
MNLAGQALRFYVPELVRRRALRELFDSTAEAFGAPAHPAPGATAVELLDLYAVFTAEQANLALQGHKDLTPIREKLYASAYTIGTRLRSELHITSTPDAIAVARAVYGVLGIDFVGAPNGEVRIERCFFSCFYSPRVCRLMSALDQGLLAGLSAGGHLEFRQRITEGAPYCAATFAEPAP